jgi:hypothetical protein
MFCFVLSQRAHDAFFQAYRIFQYLVESHEITSPVGLEGVKLRLGEVCQLFKNRVHFSDQRNEFLLI